MNAPESPPSAGFLFHAVPSSFPNGYILVAIKHLSGLSGLVKPLAALQLKEATPQGYD